jgi:hypothetical protein
MSAVPGKPGGYNLQGSAVARLRRNVTMQTVTPRYVVDEHQQPTDVVLTIAEWRRVLGELEELEDIRAYDEAKTAPQQATPLAQVARELRAGRTP